MFDTSQYPLVLEAIKNGDFSFRLPTKGLMPGERAARETINKMLEMMQEQRQNIEMASWEKLTRILTHEIMNSLAPIVSLSDTFMQEEEIKKSEYYDGIKAIHDTSEGLCSFVDSYRKFSSLQQPQPEHILVSDLISGITKYSELVEITTSIEPHALTLYADPNLIRQIIINIVKNAIEASATKIHISAYQYNNNPLRIVIANNGKTISEEEQKEIFVPFFTTKKTGNGIGLSLCRQIMTISGGSIELLPANTNGWNVSFQLLFHQTFR
ncbi:MAG: HAMP domain-containing histidine kinase [Bacteroidaceae bacterium]|nr:HAMP domain-containing histidine kinase [Bacteroidaceae bacterium]